MNPLRGYQRHLRIEVLIAVAAYSVASQGFELGFVLAAAIIVSGYVATGPRGRVLPRMVAGTALVGVLAWNVYEFALSPSPDLTMITVSRVSVMIATLRLFERRTPREDAQLISLSVVAVIAASLYSVELLFGVIVFVFAVETVYVVMLNRLHGGLVRSRERRRELEADTPVPPFEAQSGRRPRWQLRLIHVFAATLAVLGAAAVFLIFPRTSDVKAMAARLQTGYAPEVDLDRIDRIEESTREVFTVEWADPRGVPVRWPSPLLLRGAVLETWDVDDRRWVNPPRSRFRRTVSTDGEVDDFSSLGPADLKRGYYTQTVIMRSLATRQVFARWVPVGISCDQPRVFVFDPATFELEDSATGRLDRFGVYSLQVQPNPTESTLRGVSGLPAPPPATTDFPVPEVRDEAMRILEERRPDLIPSPGPTATQEESWRRRREIAEVFTEYLLGPEFRYTLDLRRVILRSDVDPIVNFLTEQRFGHCEFFASALCALCQSMGVEARIVTGFVAVEFDDRLRKYIVRESNAHAWVEVRVGPYAWREYDPTSSETLEELQAGRRSWADEYRWLYDRFDFLWTSRFVAFDGDSQATLVDQIGRSFRTRFAEIIGSVESYRRRSVLMLQLGSGGWFWFGIVAVALATGVLAVALARRRRAMLRRSIGAVTGRELRSAAFYLDVLAAFEKLGRPKPRFRSPLEHVRSLRHEVPEFSAAAEELVEIFYDVRFGHRSLDRKRRSDAEDAARRLRMQAAEIGRIGHDSTS